MAITSTWLNSHMDFALAHYAQTVTIAGTEYACAAGEQTKSSKLDESGFLSEDGVEIMVKTSSLSAVPSAGSTLTFNSITYRIATVTRAPDGIHTVFNCRQEND